MIQITVSEEEHDYLIGCLDQYRNLLEQILELSISTQSSLPESVVKKGRKSFNDQKEGVEYLIGMLSVTCDSDEMVH